MHDLDRIEELLSSKEIDSDLFERFAQDALSEVYPGLSPIPGGTDFGRDGDITNAEASVQRLMVTRSRTLDGVRANMLRGIESLKKHGVTDDVRPVLVSLAELSVLNRQSLSKSAAKRGVKLAANDIYDRRFVAGRLRRDGDWRKKLLDLPSTPISLLPATSDSVDSPWATLSLVGRDPDVEALQDISSDVILSGPPGVGKSRVAGVVNGSVFVNPHAPTEQLANDIRWANPTVLIVDDAGSAGDLLQQLRQWRRAEPEVFHYRILAVCWPDEASELATFLVDAEQYELDLLERGPMDQLVKEMGITGHHARAEILDQSEGRPGWAVSLGAVLLQSNQFASLLNGRALLGEASGYLRRAGADPDDLEVLTTVAALGSVSEQERGRLAASVGVSIAKLSASIGRAATAGLIDVSTRYTPSGDVRFYELRPPMLADALLTERAFSATMPTLDLLVLAEAWPDHLAALTERAVDAARLGGTGARPVADELFERLLGDQESPSALLGVARKYALLDEIAGSRILTLCQAALEELCISGRDDIGWANQNAVELAAIVAGRYRSQPAVVFLLESALLDRRPQAQTPAHPIRRLEDVVHSFHPELQRPIDTRDFIAVAACEWWSSISDPEDSSEQQVFATVVGSLLSPRIRASFTDPGAPHQVSIFEGLVSVDEMRHILEEIWPRLQRMLRSGDDIIAGALIRSVGDWLRFGAGYDRPFGRDHPAESVAEAEAIGLRMSEKLRSESKLSLGSQLNLRDILARHDIDLDVAIPSGWEPLLRDLDRGPDVDYAERDRVLATDIAAAVRDWANQPPEVVVDRLLELKRVTNLAHLDWPNRPLIAAAALAERVDSPLFWLMTAEERGLVPEAAVFMPRVFQEGLASAEVVERFLANPITRSETIGQCLLSEGNFLKSMAINELLPDDFQLLEVMFLRKQLDDETIQALLTQPVERVRGMVAIAMFAGQGGPYAEGWDPGDLEDLWLHAVLQFRSNERIIADHHAAGVFAYLAVNQSEALLDLVIASLNETADGSVLEAFTHGSWLTLASLPNPARRRLLAQFQGRPVVMWILRQHVVGWDVSWLDELLDAGEMTPEEVLGGYNGLDGLPPLEPYAQLLVPRGVPPERVAGLRMSGFWTGEQSTRFANLIGEFETMAESDDSAVQVVGSAGVKLYSELRDAALREEHQRRIRGEL